MSSAAFWWASSGRPASTPLPRLHVVGGFFQQEGGIPFTLIETSDFNLYNRWLRGEDILPVLQQRKDIGFNTLRIFTQFDIRFSNGEQIQLFDPQYGKLPSFLQLLNDYGFYAELTAYTGPYTWGYSTEHWYRLRSAVQGATNTLLSLVNENSQPNNRLDPSPFLPDPVIPCSRGTDVAPTAGWAWTELHSNGQFEWQRKVGHNTMEIAAIYGVGGNANENQRYPDMDNSLIHAEDAAKGGSLLTGGSCYHSIHGRTSQLFVGTELDAARAWVAGAKSVPLSCQPFPYRHRQDLEGPGDLRVYQRGTDPTCIVHIRV